MLSRVLQRWHGMNIRTAPPSRLCVALCVVYILAFCGYSALPASRSSTDVFLWYSSLHSVLGITLALVWRTSIAASPLLLVVLFLLPRLLVVPMMPWLSDDVYRYLWDGLVLVHGHNPYASAPNAEHLAHLHNNLYALMDYKDVPTVYPPLAQVSFGLATTIGSLFGSSWHNAYFAWKALLLLSEAIGVYYTTKLLRTLALPLSGIVLYLCLPLPVVELVGQAHIDGILLAPLGAFLYTCSRLFTYNGDGSWKQPLQLPRTVSLSSGFLASALFLLKLTPVVVVLPLLRQRALHRSIVITSAAAVSLSFFLPLFLRPDALHNFLATAQLYTNTLQFNGIALYSLAHLLEFFRVREWWLVAPSVLSILRFGITMLYGLWHKAATPRVLYGSMLNALLAITLVSGKVHVWYLVSLLLLNAITGYVWLPIFASASLLTYAIYSGQQAQEAYGVEYALWAAGLLLLLGEWWIHRKRQKA